jgi:hypothetical protein
MGGDGQGSNGVSHWNAIGGRTFATDVAPLATGPCDCVAVMDGEFAAIDLLHRLRRYMVVITRLRLDACLFDPPSV